MEVVCVYFVDLGRSTKKIRMKIYNEIMNSIFKKRIVLFCCWQDAEQWASKTDLYSRSDYLCKCNVATLYFA